MATGEVDLMSYLVRIVLALIVMSVSAFVFVYFAKNKGWVRQNEAHVKIMASLPLGKDVFFVLRCGPEVIALTSGAAGTRLMGRWNYEEWMQREENEREATDRKTTDQKGEERDGTLLEG